MALKAGRVGVRKDQVDVNGIIDMTNVPTELPEYDSTDAGKILAVDNAGELEFENIPTELPEYDSTDAGKVLEVDDSGKLSFENIIIPAGFSVEKFESDSMPKTFPKDGLLIGINHGDGTQAVLTMNYPTWGNYTATFSSHNIAVFPVEAGTVASISNDGGKRNTFFYYS